MKIQERESISIIEPGQMFSAVVNERAGISPDLAIKLSGVFGNAARFRVNLHKLRHAEVK